MNEEDRLNNIDDLDAEIKALREKRQALANKTPKEGFNGKKFVSGMFSVLNPVAWAKDLASILNIRKLIIYILIFGSIFGWGWTKGRGSKPIMVNVNDFETILTLKEGANEGDALRIRADSGKLYYQILHKDGTESKEYVVRNRDIPTLKTWGIGLKPKFFMGYSSDGPAAGGGFEFAHAWKLNFDVFFMSDLNIYTGISYDLETKNKFLSNSAVGLALGKSLENVEGTNIMAYWTIKF